MQIPQENSIRINRPIVIGNPLSSFLPLFCWRPVIHIVKHFIPVSITNVINIRHQFHNLTRMPVYNDALTRNFLPPFCHSQLVSVILFLVVLFPGTIAVPRLEKMPDTDKKRGRKLRRRRRDRGEAKRKWEIRWWMISVIICGHFLATCFSLSPQVHQATHPSRSFLPFIPSRFFFARFFLLSSLSSCHFCLPRPRSRWMRNHRRCNH